MTSLRALDKLADANYTMEGALSDQAAEMRERLATVPIFAWSQGRLAVRLIRAAERSEELRAANAVRSHNVTEMAEASLDAVMHATVRLTEAVPSKP